MNDHTTAVDRPEVDDPRVLALAVARQQMAYESPFNFVCPPWDGLSEQEQHLSLLDARNYLRAALKAGLVPAVVPSVGVPALRDRVRRAVCEAEGFAWDSSMLEPDEYGDVADAVLAALPAPADRAAVLTEAAEAVAKHVARAIFALKSPQPPGSEHYRSGWDDGLEAAIDAARDELLRRLAGEAAPDNTETPVVDRVVAYSGKGRVFCVACPRPDGVDVPLTINDVGSWDLCPSCGRHVVDVAAAGEADRG